MRELLSWQNMPIKRKDVKKRVYHDEAITYGEFYGIAVDEYIDTPTTALPFSVRVINRFMSNGITRLFEHPLIAPRDCEAGMNSLNALWKHSVRVIAGIKLVAFWGHTLQYNGVIDVGV